MTTAHGLERDAAGKFLPATTPEQREAVVEHAREIAHLGGAPAVNQNAVTSGQRVKASSVLFRPLRFPPKRKMVGVAWRKFRRRLDEEYEREHGPPDLTARAVLDHALATNLHALFCAFWLAEMIANGADREAINETLDKFTLTTGRFKRALKDLRLSRQFADESDPWRSFFSDADRVAIVAEKEPKPAGRE